MRNGSRLLLLKAWDRAGNDDQRLGGRGRQGLERQFAASVSDHVGLEDLIEIQGGFRHAVDGHALEAAPSGLVTVLQCPPICMAAEGRWSAGVVFAAPSDELSQASHVFQHNPFSEVRH